MRFLVFAGSTRKDSLNRKLALAALESLKRAGVQADFVDLRDYPMPLYDGDTEAQTGLPERAKAFKELVRGYDGLVIASPEYNGSFPALVKNTIDWISRVEGSERPLAVLRGKTAALLSASPGPGGGQRGLKHLRELLGLIGVNVLTPQVVVTKATSAFNEQGRLVRTDVVEAVDQLTAELAGLVLQPAAV
jgi:chromate reductase